MKMKSLVCCLLAFFMFTGNLYAAETAAVNNAEIAGSVAAGGTALAAGAAASTMSGATIMTTLASIGAGSAAAGIGVVAAAPIAVGAVVYAVWHWCSDDDKDEK